MTLSRLARSAHLQDVPAPNDICPRTFLFVTNRSSYRSSVRRRALAAVVAVAGLSTFAPLSAAVAAPETRTDYIVVLRTERTPSAAAVAEDHRRNGGADVRRVYEHAVKGYAASMTEKQAAKLAGDPRVEYIEVDQVVQADEVLRQTPATWGLDRIDQEQVPLGGSYDYTSTGRGVTAYIVDTGIYAANSEFAGRLAPGVDKVGGNSKGGDCDGHGTHVAGTVGGTTYGVAKDVTLVPVRVLDCRGSGTWSGVISGLDWIVAHHVSGPAVANMSLGGGASSTVDAAVKKVIGDGVTVAVAAGNGDRRGVAQNACNSSPARVPDALTISATDASDRKASWANYGTCVDAFAPGVNITSAWMGGTRATNTISGTSMATPHVAGAAARYLSMNTSATPAGVSAALLNTATINRVTSAGTGSPNRLLYMSPAA